MAICSGCGGEHNRTGQRYCLDCHAAYMRKWRKTHALTPAQRKKDRARSYARSYQRRGLLIQQSCEECGAPETEKHHPDYDEPLEVVWLCRPCHLKLHQIETVKRFSNHSNVASHASTSPGE